MRYFNYQDTFYNESQPDIFSRTINLLMKTRGWKEQPTGKQDAELLILTYSPKDLPNISITDLAVFRRFWKRILLFFPFPQKVPQNLDCHLDWYFPCGVNSSNHDSFPNLKNWLEVGTENKTSYKKRIPNEYRKLARSLLSTDSDIDFDTIIDQSGFKSELKTISEKLQSTDKLSEFLLNLLKMSKGYDQHEHTMNRELINLFVKDKNKEIKSKESGVLQAFQQKQIIDFCFDLNRSLGATYSASEGKNYVLVIEDNPDKIKKRLKAIKKIFFKDHSFFLLSLENSPKKLIDYWEKYNSLSNQLDSELENTKLDCLFGEEESKPFKDIKNQIRFVLVDILLPDKPVGIQVIQGLVRYFQDCEEIKKPVDVIALSQADDIEKIHAALRAGASGYVLKSRLLTIPAIVSETAGENHESHKILKRNFRSLYNLPNDTIRLIRKTIIPGIDLSASDEQNDEKRFLALPMARILQNMPKTDLHVHVGSCMSPEFLVTASLIMLARHASNDDHITDLRGDIKLLVHFFKGNKFTFNSELCVDDRDKIFNYYNTKSGILNLAKITKKFLKSQIIFYEKVIEGQENQENVLKNQVIIKRYKNFRSILHEKLGIADHLDEKGLKEKITSVSDISIFQLAIICSQPNNDVENVGTNRPINKDDLLRVFLLYLAAINQRAYLNIDDDEWLVFFRDSPPSDDKFSIFHILHDKFWKSESPLSIETLRNENWELKNQKTKIKVNLTSNDPSKKPDLLFSNLDFKRNPIEYVLATGTRSRNLKTYLEGCEFAGAEHLYHPFLIHLYAQQTVHQFVQYGVLYAELRAAVVGYEFRHENDLFSFQDACSCLERAFKDAPRNISNEVANKETNVGLWEKPFVPNRAADSGDNKSHKTFPTKVSIILTGKRHKPVAQMIKEASSAIVLHKQSRQNTKTAQSFALNDMNQCRLVGFDLAGQEDAFPPSLFTNEFSYLTQMHIPVTVHAGENAPSEFVESAIIDLRARRLGHGLALVDDARLMNQVREADVCVELCPVSNYQTNQFHPKGRQYPLKKLLDNGNSVCLNTDNPSISNTNIIKEYFQASFAYNESSGESLTLWNLLRIIRMGFVHSFLSLPEKRAILELADQILFDLFSDPDVIEELNLWSKKDIIAVMPE